MSDIVLVDTHCHIHDIEFMSKYDRPVSDIMADARAEGVQILVMVGTDAKSSRAAAEFTERDPGCYASIALHPHEAADVDLATLKREFAAVEKLADAKKVVAVGECGLDYFYHTEPEIRERQQTVFRWHIELALRHNLPLIFHIREAFDDFFRIIDEYDGVRGVVHSFSAGEKELQGALKRGLYIGLNGIMTFTKQASQLAAAKAVPLEKMVLETDAPFLTPAPFRGKMCEPKHVRVTAEFLAGLRGESLEQLAEATTANAKQLFGI